MDPHAHAEVDADPVKFEEAIRAFRARVPMTDDEFDQLVENEREFAFTVAGVAQAELVADVYEAVQRAIEDGTDLETFQADIGPALEESWGGEEPGRLENIFRTNVMGAYNAGRYSAATAPAVKRERPYWRMETVDDSRQTEICQACRNVCLPADHPWWRTHYPPLHYQCRDHVTTLTQEQAEEFGITDSPPDVQPMPGFGAAPSSGGTDWVPDTSDLPEPIGDLLQSDLD
jgi:uncharacterized protein with gpF-like domain